MLISTIFLIIICIYLLFVPEGKLLRKSILLFLIIMFPFRRWHLPTWLSPKIKIKEYRLKFGRRLLFPDIYRPADNKKYSPIVVFAPLAKEGKRDRLVVNFIKGLARLGFVVMVPYWPNRPVGEIYPTDTQDLVHSVEWLTQRSDIREKTAGLVAVSYGSGPAIIASVNKRIKDKIKFLALISGYLDLLSVAKMIITKKFSYKKINGQVEPDSYARYVFFRNAGRWCTNINDRRIFFRLAKFTNSNKKLEQKIGQFRSNLSKAGRKILDWATSKNSQEFRRRFLQISIKIKKYFFCLTPSEQIIKSINSPILILHSYIDRLIPYTESVKLYDKVKKKVQAQLVLISAFDHTMPMPAVFQNIWRVYLPNFVKITGFILAMLKLQMKK